MPTFLEALVNGWWQGIVLTLVVWLVLREAVRLSAATRLAIWQVTLAVVVLLPVLQWLPGEAKRPETRMVAATPVSPKVSATPVEPILETPMPAAQAPLVELPEADAAAFFAGLGFFLAFVQLLRVAVGYGWMWWIKRRSRDSGMALPQFLSRDARIVWNDHVRMPMALGYLHPRVVLPERLRSEMSEEQLQQVVWHEAAHLERRDDWFALIERLVRVVFAIQPAVWLIGKEIDREREMACDDWVVAQSGEAKAYAAALTRVAEIGSTGRAPILAAGAGRRKEIFARVEALLDETRNRMPGASGPMVLATVLLLVFVVVQAAPFSRLLGIADFQRSSVIDDGKTRREFRMNGDVVFREDEQDVDSLASGSRLMVSRREGWVTRTVEIEADDQGRVSRRYFVGGLTQPYGAEAKRFLERELPQWLKDREDRLPERLAKWLQNGGVDGALREIQTVTNGNAKMLYLEGLLKDSALDSVQMRRWIRIASGLHSDEEKLRIVEKVRDHAKAMGLEAALLDMIHTMHAHELRSELLGRMIRELEPGLAQRLLREVAELHSEELKKDLLLDVSRQLASPLPAAFFEAARGVHDEESRKQLLLDAIERHGKERSTQELVLTEASKLNGGREQREVLLAVAAQPQLAEDVREKARAIANRMNGEEDREAVLKGFSSR